MVFHHLVTVGKSFVVKSEQGEGWTRGMSLLDPPGFGPFQNILGWKENSAGSRVSPVLTEGSGLT